MFDDKINDTSRKLNTFDNLNYFIHKKLTYSCHYIDREKNFSQAAKF